MGKELTMNVADFDPKEMSGVDIQAIPHKKQRYKTCGDWFFSEDGTLRIRVSKELGDWRYCQLVAIHEMAEVQWCVQNGVTTEDVDKFDDWYEENRASEDKTSEPGDHPDAPYREGHKYATIVEKTMAEALGVDWDTYEAAIAALR